MSDLNSVLIEGHLNHNPGALVNTEGPVKRTICDFTIKVVEAFKDDNGNVQEAISYFSIEARGKIAIKCNKHLTKGRKVRIIGKLKQYRYNHDRKEYIYIIADRVEFKPDFERGTKDERG